MKTEEMKPMVDALHELNESCMDAIQAMKGTVREVKTARQLWRVGDNSRLIKLGLALIAFPEPTTISDILGTALVAAGAVQKGIRRRALYAEDACKTFQNMLKEVWNTRDTLHKNKF